MGGLVLKRAFILSCQDPVYADVSHRIHSVFFLATPHRGADSAHVLENILRVFHGKVPYLADLNRGSAATQSINDEFRQWAETLQLWSFYESERTSLGFTSKLIVDKTSAILEMPGERTALLNADHRNVCKFDSPTDPNYLSVRNALLSATDEIKTEGKSWDLRGCLLLSSL